MNSIPAGQLVGSIPSVLAAGGNPLSLNGVFHTADTSIPIGTVKSFPDSLSVQNWFGVNAPESILGSKYFSGFIGADSLPSALFFAQYNAAAVAGYIRSGSFAGASLASIQALSGVLTVTTDGVAHVTPNVNLATATSFTNAATLITAGLAAATPASTALCTYDTLRAAFVITSPTTGAASTLAYVTGTLSAPLKLTQASGAILSAGAVAATPAGAMNAIVAATQNWATFSTVFEPDIATALGFAAWTNAVSPAGLQRFLYVEWDSVAANGTGPNAAGFGALAIAGAFNGSMPNYDLSAGQKAAFVMGAIASIDTNATNGRITLAYKGQAGLVPDVTDSVTAANLIGNGYNFYGAYATANQAFQFLQPGSMPGPWKWVDPYVNQIAMNADFQLAMMLLETQVKSIPYNTAGYNLVRSSLLDPIAKYVNFGAIQPNVPLSALQAQQVNSAAGARISDVLSTVGWYLQILPASPTVRGLRGSPPMKFWYMDGGSIQSLLLATIDVQ